MGSEERHSLASDQQSSNVFMQARLTEKRRTATGGGKLAVVFPNPLVGGKVHYKRNQGQQYSPDRSWRGTKLPRDGRIAINLAKSLFRKRKES